MNTLWGIDSRTVAPGGVMIAAAPEGSNRVWVESSEPLVAASGGEVDIVFKRSGVSDALAVASVGAGVMRFDVAVPEAFGPALEVGDSDVILVDGDADDSIRPRMANCDYTTPGALPGTLVARIWSGSLDNLPGTQSTVLIRSGAVTDFAGNASGRHSAVRVERPDEGG